MSREFTRYTKYYEFEVMMTQIPNFDKRINGLYMSKPKNVRASGKCIYCTEYRKKKGCRHTQCPYMLERAEMGAVNYGEIVNDCIQGVTVRGFKKRIANMMNFFDGRIFLNDEHKYNFNSTLGEIKLVNENPSEKQMAAIYILTANSRLWSQVQVGINPRDIDFTKMHIHNLSTDSYAFYLAAKSIYTGEPKIKCSEIVDDELISDDAFKIMVHGGIVLKYGAELLKVKFNSKCAEMIH